MAENRPGILYRAKDVRCEPRFAALLQGVDNHDLLVQLARHCLLENRPGILYRAKDGGVDTSRNPVLEPLHK